MKSMHFLGGLANVCTLPETNSKFTPENGWLEYKPFLLGFGLLRGWIHGAHIMAI